MYTKDGIQVYFFWVVTSHGVEVGYQCFRGPCCLHLQSEDGGSMTLQKMVRICQTEIGSWWGASPKISLHGCSGWWLTEQEDC